MLVLNACCHVFRFDGHADCVRFIKSLGIPMIVVGGGGYTLRNVARCWANETGVLVDVDLPNEIPENAGLLNAYTVVFSTRLSYYTCLKYPQ